MKKSAQGIVRRTRGRDTDTGEAASIDTPQFGADILQSDVTITRLLNGDLSFGINGSTDQITDQMRRRTYAVIINGGKAANDETTNAWRIAA